MTAEALTLTEFLLARIAEDEETASHGDGGLMDHEDGARFDRRRVLAECEAKRRIVADALDHDEQYRIERTPTREGMRWAAMVAVGQLAVVYADHPDYREEWRP